MDERTGHQLNSGLIDKLEQTFLDAVRQAEQSEELRATLYEMLVPMLAIVLTLRVPGPTDWSSEDVRRAADRATAQLRQAIARVATLLK